MQESLQSYIYTEKLLADLYRHAASRVSIYTERETMLRYSQSCIQAMRYLNYFYKEMTGEYYEPFIPEVKVNRTYRELLDEIQRIEVETFLEYRKSIYKIDNYLLQETMRAIGDLKLGHILAILAIVTNMNKPR